ncbi:MAG: hypothetical protein IPO69_08980 [Saprospiraceae bacterium]|nr:hypothetical protein [Saprospiraceae bacterium]
MEFFDQFVSFLTINSALAFPFADGLSSMTNWVPGLALTLLPDIVGEVGRTSLLVNGYSTRSL